MMTQYAINGTMKRTQKYCPKCKFGKAFSKEQRFQTDTMCEKTYERICNECLTKYKIPYIPLGFQVEAYPGRQISIDSFKAWEQSDDGWLNDKNQAFHTIRIAMEHNKEVNNMLNNGDELIGLMDTYGATHSCPKHVWIESKPFRTAEGTFTIKSCAVCKLGTVVHKGKLYEDKLMNLVRFISYMGIQAEKEKLQKEQELLNLFDVEIFEAQKTTQELPSFDLEEKPVFELDIPVF